MAVSESTLLGEVGATADNGPPYAVVVEDVSIHYRSFTDRRRGLSKMFISGMRSRSFQEVKAVQGVSFAVRAGEGVGVIGSNGSGKSTLLRAIAGLQPMTSGRILTAAQPRLLGVGAALKPELSGRRNITVGCLALGLTKQQADESVDEIIEFSGIRDFIDMPMRTYSKGMKARLAFSIATSISPRILLIDEVLAVGDREFRGRSMERLDGIRQEAGTVFFVSHSLGQIKRISDRVIWLDQGILRADGEPDEVIAMYREVTGGGDDD